MMLGACKSLFLSTFNSIYLKAQKLTTVSKIKLIIRDSEFLVRGSHVYLH